MNTSSNKNSSRRINVLTLDGGGVRGLSTLLILRELMSKINSSIQSKRPGSPTVEPHHIFDLVAGTSTGGLIAIMLGKLGMNITECIEAYGKLSKKIFGKKHVRGIITGGLAPSKYSGKRLKRRVCKLLKERGYREELPMTEEEPPVTAGNNSDKIACALVCREHQGERYSKFKRKAVCICSRTCPDSPECLVYEAARATSAAPTYFPLQKIGNRNFVDGGLEFNNPSHVIFDHYIKANRVSKLRRMSIATETSLQLACHEDFGFSQARLINLGTGTDPETPEKHGTSVPGLGFIRMGMFLKRELKKIAVDSERTAEYMRSLAETAGDIKYVRFSADTGVCFVELDKYKELEKIADLTSKYLSNPRVQGKMHRVAEEVAADYLANAGHLTSDRLEVPDTKVFRPQTPISEADPSKSQASSATKSSTDRSKDWSENSAQNTPSKASNSADTEATTPRSERRSASMSREKKE